MIYAVGDIHGCLDEWLELKNRIEKKDNNAQFILLGDIIDRGPKVVEMCDWAFEHISKDGKYQMIIGNHEHDKILNFDDNMKHYKDLNDVRKYWEDEVRWDIDDHYGSVKLFDTYDHYERMIDFFRTLPYYKDITVNDQRFIIVHANLSFNAIEDDYTTLKSDSELDINAKDFIVWDRGCIDFDKIDNAILINGHTPTIFVEAFKFQDCLSFDKLAGKIYHTKNRYNIDCGITYRQYDKRGNLAILCLDTLEEIYLY